MAISEMRRTGVPASITLAQGIIESDYGRSSLVTNANNHFGIKCHSDWTGDTYFHNDDTRNECFRKYKNPKDSFRDHSDFLVSGPRYDFLFDLKPTDYKAWAVGLKKAGYATNPDYAEMLIKKIEELGLFNYDVNSTVSEAGKVVETVKEDTIQGNEEATVVQIQDTGNSAKPSGYSRILVRNRISYIIVKEGDTFKSLLDEFQLLRWELQKYNDLGPDFSIEPGQLLYLQPKRNFADAGNDYHIVKEGETIYQISQLYGIKLIKLQEMNRMDVGIEPVAGQKIWLRSIKPPV